MQYLKLVVNNKNIGFWKCCSYATYKISKNLRPKNEGEKYLVKDSQNKIINKSENLQNLIKKIIWKKFKLVN